MRRADPQAPPRAFLVQRHEYAVAGLAHIELHVVRTYRQRIPVRFVGPAGAVLAAAAMRRDGRTPAEITGHTTMIDSCRWVRQPACYGN